jgi:hypothetical protein
MGINVLETYACTFRSVLKISLQKEAPCRISELQICAYLGDEKIQGGSKMTGTDLCGLFTHKAVPVIFEPPCTYKGA